MAKADTREIVQQWFCQRCDAAGEVHAPAEMADALRVWDQAAEMHAKLSPQCAAVYKDKSIRFGARL